MYAGRGEEEVVLDMRASGRRPADVRTVCWCVCLATVANNKPRVDWTVHSFPFLPAPLRNPHSGAGTMLSDGKVKPFWDALRLQPLLARWVKGQPPTARRADNAGDRLACACTKHVT